MPVAAARYACQGHKLINCGSEWFWLEEGKLCPVAILPVLHLYKFIEGEAQVFDMDSVCSIVGCAEV